MSASLGVLCLRTPAPLAIICYRTGFDKLDAFVACLSVLSVWGQTCKLVLLPRKPESQRAPSCPMPRFACAQHGRECLYKLFLRARGRQSNGTGTGTDDGAAHAINYISSVRGGGAVFVLAGVDTPTNGHKTQKMHRSPARVRNC